MRMSLCLLFLKWSRSVALHCTQVCPRGLLSSSCVKLHDMSSVDEKSTCMNKLFEGKKDRYNGVIVNSSCEPCKFDCFPVKLKESLKHWSSINIRTVWFSVGLKQADWIPVLAKNGFKFHRTKDDDVIMYKWLPVSEECNVPSFAHTMIGVGAVVMNSVGELLVVRERFSHKAQWKLPGGYVEPGENLGDAAVREVLEETSVKTEFLNLVSLRHMHNANFGCSDIYFIAHLKPLSDTIEKCDKEIEACIWMKVEEFLDHPQVHEGNKFFVRKCMEYRQEGRSIGCVQSDHPVINRPQCVYSIMLNGSIPKYKLQESD